MLMSLWLTKYNVPHRIIDKALSIGTTSRATVVHARTLEMYRMLGIDEELVNVGAKIEKLALSTSGRLGGEVILGDAGIGRSQYPFILSATQDEHEEVLQRHLDAVGVKVERGIEMVRMDAPLETDAKSYVKVTVRPVGGDKEEVITASYVIGCDGAHSPVRHATGITMEGGTYERQFFVADVSCHGLMQTVGKLNVCFSPTEYQIMLPLPHKDNRARVIGVVPLHLDHPDEDITFEDCLPVIKRATPSLVIDEVRWFAHYRVHHRTAARFQYGHRVFLCGDAAHLHSPVGKFCSIRYLHVKDAP